MDASISSVTPLKHKLQESLRRRGRRLDQAPLKEPDRIRNHDIPNLYTSIGEFLTTYGKRPGTLVGVAYDVDQVNIGSASNQITQVITHIASLGITVPRPDTIKTYLRYHFDMLDIAVRVSELLTRKLGSDCEITLEYYQSPEDNDTQMVFFVRQPNNGKEIYKRIQSIWDAYSEDLSDKSGWLLVTPDFRAR